jgi:hypothetical protein
MQPPINYLIFSTGNNLFFSAAKTVPVLSRANKFKATDLDLILTRSGGDGSLEDEKTTSMLLGGRNLLN